MTKEKLFEQLADIEHQRWASWQKYVHATCSRSSNGDLIIPFSMVQHWQNQINTPYQNLSEHEKNSDREQVKRYWPLIEKEIQDVKNETLEVAAQKCDNARHYTVTDELAKCLAEDIRSLIQKEGEPDAQEEE